ncbi:MAG TPA: VOC family protein [Candidatus Binatia bacterium]|nr:VOC family protein [Candidatus Binatia bacterium]
MLRIKGLDHVGLTVTDMDRSLDFYTRLGLEVLRTSGPDAKGVRSAVVKVGGQELNVFSRPDLVPLDARDNAVGMDHFCLRMEAASVEALMADLRQAGLEVVRGPIKRRDGTSLFLADPDGVRVELQLFD